MCSRRDAVGLLSKLNGLTLTALFFLEHLSLCVLKAYSLWFIKHTSYIISRGVSAKYSYDFNLNGIYYRECFGFGSGNVE